MIGVPAWVEQYTNIPFRELGFDRSGCHCWGLVRLVLTERGGLTDLPLYAEATASALLAAARVISRDKFIPPWHGVDGDWRELDVVIMEGQQLEGKKLHRFEGHVGVVVSPQYVLHIERGIDSVCVRRTHASIRNRVLQVVRHEARGA